MEVGKLHTPSKTHQLFYYIVDKTAPDTPSSSRLQTYFVSTTLDSYVESYYFLAKSLSGPINDAALRPWHSLYCRVFGNIEFDSFVKNLQSLNSAYFSLHASEAAARKYIDEYAAKASLPQGRESNLLVHARRDGDADAAVELHRLRTELTEVSGKLRVEKGRQQMSNLGDAERAAIQYKYEQAMRDAEAERLKASDAEERMRTQIKTMQERIDRLLGQHEDALKDMGKADRERVVAIEDAFLKRETEMQAAFEEALGERDRKLTRAATRIEAMERQIGQLTDQLMEGKENEKKFTHMLNAANEERRMLSDTIQQQKAALTSLDNTAEEQSRHIRRLEEMHVRGEHEVVGLRLELARWRAEADRYARFTASLQGELKTLDNTSATAADLLRRKVLLERAATHRNQLAYNQYHQ